MLIRRRLTVRGIVQGIGFRPFVYRLARELGLSGSVRNDGRGVKIEIQGTAAAADELRRRLADDLPASGRLDAVEAEPLEPLPDERGFSIAASSDPGGALGMTLAPDRWVCPDCLREMRDPADRRHRYPFINCTACGPRYTIVRSLPYDRPGTTMAAFEMCEKCAREYTDPTDRRYHAQPIACPVCGPRAWIVAGGRELHRDDPGAAAEEAVRRLADGQLVAIKGIGGFHLAVDARNEAAVARLREFKRRSRKPLAVMVRDLEVARRLVVLNDEDERLLGSAAAPIVLAPAREDNGLANGLAPGLVDLGLMLAYSPLHHQLFDGPLDALVMTSGNHPSEPITADNDDALERLPADAHLLHDREIAVANDDSVVRSSPLGAIFVRRSRGYVPDPIDASHLPRRSVLALGAELKSTLATLARGELVVGRHLGDLDNARAEAAFRTEVERMLAFGRVEPEAVAIDLHPDLASSIFAERELGDLPIVRIQHHWAHLAAVMLEHGLEPDSELAALSLDGVGLGEDGTVWGGELLVGGYRGCERVAALRPVPLPGGDAAAREPGRMATSLLWDAGLGGPEIEAWDERIAGICSLRSVSPLCSSAGRLFDGVAALLGLTAKRQGYEGEAASLLEAVSDPACDEAYPLPPDGDRLDTRALVSALVEDRDPVPLRAARFHNGLADGLARAALETGRPLVALGGGCMVNRLLLARLVRGIEAGGAGVLWPRRLPPGDGGLSAGQAACAACLLESRKR